MLGLTDTGRALGKHKLAPKNQSGKTWEGVFGGVVAALAMAALSHYWFFRELPPQMGLAAGTCDDRDRRNSRDLTESAHKAWRRCQGCCEYSSGTWRHTRSAR